MVLLLVLLISLCQAKWSDPVPVAMAYQNSSNLIIFTDNSNGVSHAFWCEPPYFHYRRIDSDLGSSSVQTMKWGPPCGFYGELHGLHDGKNMILVYKAHRKYKRFLGGCNKDPDACYDIFISTTKDGGVSWSKPLAVTRRDMNDKVIRQYPKVLITPQNRIWIFYRITNFGVDRMAYVMKPEDSSVFSSEKQFSFKVREASVAFTDLAGYKNVTIFFVEKFEPLQYYYTNNNGINWLGPVSAAHYCKANKTEVYPFSHRFAPSYLFVVCHNDRYKKFFSISPDAGKAWKTVDLPERLDMTSFINRFSITGDNRENTMISYGYKNLCYIKTTGTKFEVIEAPNIPRYSHCDVLTSSYNSGIFMFWYRTENKDKNKTAKLWVAQAKMIKSETEIG